MGLDYGTKVVDNEGGVRFNTGEIVEDFVVLYNIELDNHSVISNNITHFCTWPQPICVFSTSSDCNRSVHCFRRFHVDFWEVINSPLFTICGIRHWVRAFFFLLYGLVCCLCLYSALGQWPAANDPSKNWVTVTTGKLQPLVISLLPSASTQLNSTQLNSTHLASRVGSIELDRIVHCDDTFNIYSALYCVAGPLNRSHGWRARSPLDAPRSQLSTRVGGSSNRLLRTHAPGAIYSVYIKWWMGAVWRHGCVNKRGDEGLVCTAN